MEERFEKLWFAKTNYFLIWFSVTQIQLKNAHKNKLRLSIKGVLCKKLLHVQESFSPAAL